jgi:hypothetical protein
MQTSQPNTSNGVDSAQNKELLWTTLQESGAFAGLTREQFQPVQSAFDRSVQQASKSMTSLSSLSDVNKHIIRQFVQTELPMLRSNPIPTNNAPKKKKIEMVYRAEDLQSERAGEFDRQLREKQAEMDSFLTLKKPTDVSFADSELKEDKPIGGEMSRLIAQELAARERELVQLKPEDIKKAQQWIGASNATNATELPQSNNATNATNAKKSVSFSNMTNVVEEVEQFEPTNEFINSENFEETDFIFSKFKKISEPLTDIGLSVAGLSVAGLSVAGLSVAGLSVAGLSEPNASITMQQLYNKLLELDQNMNTRHIEIMARLKRA